MLRLRCASMFGVCVSWLALLIGCGEQGATRSRLAEYRKSSIPADAAMPTASTHPTGLDARGSLQREPLTDQGRGPGMGGDKYAHIQENPFVSVQSQPLSTFSIDVDTASYSKTRMYLLQQRRMPPADAVRIEELVNYFQYSYAAPTNKDPFAVHVEVAQCPWKPSHLLARVGLKGREVERERPPGNLVFLLDVSGSMDAPNKLGLVQQSIRMLTSQLTERDRVAVVVYAGAAGLVLPPTYGDRKSEILDAIDRLRAGGSTNGGQGIQLAYNVAQQNLISQGVNRVILCTDGDFNVGVTSTGDLVRLAESGAKTGIFLTVLGFGMGNHNDALLEEISGKANGTYAFIDNESEARKVFVEQINSTLVTIAKDVKIQIEFNPTAVSAYRLMGYENRLLAAYEFNDDRKDAGEVGAGHSITALYELIPYGTDEPLPSGQVDALKYQGKQQLTSDALGGELMTVKLRYKRPDADTSQLISSAVPASDKQFREASVDFRFAASVAAFGMLLRKSAHCGDANLDAVLEIATGAMGDDKHGHRREFLDLVTAARQLARGEEVRAGGLLPVRCVARADR